MLGGCADLKVKDASNGLESPMLHFLCEAGQEPRSLGDFLGGQERETCPSPHPQRTVPRRSQSECRSEGSREVRLIGESRVKRDLDQRALPVNPLPCEFETAHE